MEASRRPPPRKPGPPVGGGPPGSPERRALARGPLAGVDNAFYGMLRLLGRHVQGFFSLVATVLGVGLIVALVAGSVFAAVGHIVAVGATQTFDEAVLRWIEARRAPFLDEVMLELTTLGAMAPAITMVLIAAVFLWMTGHKYSVFLLSVSLVGGSFLNDVLKDFYERPRPIVVDAIADVGSMSFPSGHAMTAMIMYGTIAYLVERLEPTQRLRVATLVLAGLVIGLIGLSRMYLGVHYPSDVIAGFLAGLAWLAFVVATMKAIQYYSGRRPEVEQEEKDLHAEEERAMGLRD